MEELSEKLGALFSDPNSLSQIQNLAKLLGLQDSDARKAPPPAPAGGASRMETASLLSSLGAEDDTTRFLRALRPLLSQPRQNKLDEALRILSVLRLFPLLKDSGFLSTLTGGG